MSCHWTRATVLVAALVLSGCAGAGAVKAAPSATPTVTATAVRTPPPSTPTPRPSAEPEPVSESDFCTTVMKQTRPAIRTLKKLAEHPDGRGVRVSDLTRPRDQLRAAEAKAPQHLRSYLHTQVAILDAAARQVSTGTKHDVPVNTFVDAKTEFILDCEMVE